MTNHEIAEKVLSLKEKIQSSDNFQDETTINEISEHLKSILVLIPKKSWPKIDWAIKVRTYTQIQTGERKIEEKKNFAEKTEKLPGIAVSLFEYLTPEGLVVSETIEPEEWVKFLSCDAKRPQVARFVPIYPGHLLSNNEAMKFMTRIIKILEEIYPPNKINYY